MVFRTDDTLTNDTGNSIGPYGFFLHCTRRSMGLYTNGSHSFQLGKAASYSALKYRFNNSGTWSNWFNLLTAQILQLMEMVLLKPLHQSLSFSKVILS